MSRPRGGIAILVVLLAALVAVPGPASASHITASGGPPPFVRMFPPNPTCNLALPGRIDFTVLTPVGSFPARLCKNATTAGGFFRMSVDLTSISLGVANISGNVVCLNVVNHTAWERDVITATNSPLVFPYLFTLLARLEDGNAVSLGGNQIAPVPLPDQAGMFVTAPGQTSCPPLPLTTTPVSSGSVVVHEP